MAEAYNHVQSVASTSWAITHNLNVAETVFDVIIDTGGSVFQKALPLSAIHTNNNTLTLTFSAAQSGRARIIG